MKQHLKTLVGRKTHAMEPLSRVLSLRALHKAMTHYKLKTRIEAILQDEGDINCADRKGNTILHVTLETCLTKVKELVTLLLDGGANVQLQNGLGETPLMFAIRFNPGCVSLIIMSEYGKDTVNIPNNQRCYPIHYAVEENNIDVVKLLFDNSAFIECKNCLGMTSLHFAANYNSNAVDQLLHGVNANRKDTWGCTPLHLANSDDCITKLLSSGAQLNIKDNRGWTPLHSAVILKDVNKLALLLQTGGEVNRQDNDGKTPLHHLESCPTISDIIIRIGNTLLDWGASMIIKDTKGRTPSDICPEVVYCSKQHNIRRACVKVSDPPKDNIGLHSYKISCLEEAERLKLVRFGQNSLYDLFRQYSDPVFLTNEPLKEALNVNDYGNQFPIYSTLLKYTYKRVNQRAYLLETAADTLKTHSKKVFETLPRELTWNILTLVDDDSLRNVMETIV